MPPFTNARPCCAPAAIAVAPDTPLTGIGKSLVGSSKPGLPSCPDSSLPHASTVAVLVSARLNAPPAEIAVTPVSPLTATGTLLDLVLPVPSCPLSLSPQAITVPFGISARLWLAPAAIALTPEMPVTATGTSRVVVLPSPSWPKPLLPQDITMPLASSARLWRPPAETEVTNLRLLTGVGRSLSALAVPVPSWRYRFWPHATAL